MKVIEFLFIINDTQTLRRTSSTPWPYAFGLVILMAFILLAVALEAAPACDDRIPIDNPARFPFNTIAAIRFDKDCIHDLKAWGSGALVGPHMVLTAGHVVYNRKEGHENETCQYIQPAAYLDEVSGDIVYPYGEREISDVKYKKTNSKYKDPTYTPATEVDYGALHIVCPFEEITTYMPMVFDYESDFINMSGYPVDDLTDRARLGDQWRTAGAVTEVEPRKMTYDARSTTGASGAPVWEYDGASGSRRLIGINVAHSTECNGIASRLVWNNEDLIREWCNWQPTILEKTAEGCQGLILQAWPWGTLINYYEANSHLLLNTTPLRLVPRPADPALQPAQRVMQFIENTFYEWEEYLQNPTEKQSPRYLRMVTPQPHWLTVREAQILLTASASWTNQVPSGRYERRGVIGETMGVPVPVEELIKDPNAVPRVDQTRDYASD